MPTDKGVKVNGRVPWGVVVAVIGALVSYGILLGQVVQIDARLSRIEAVLLKGTTTTTVPYYNPHERTQNESYAMAVSGGCPAPRMQ